MTQPKKFEFPNSKIELHQWVNTGLLTIVGFVGVATYNEIRTDHERIASHDTMLAVHEIRLAALESKGGKKESVITYPIEAADVPKILAMIDVKQNYTIK